VTFFVAVFIFLLWFILFGKKVRKGIPLNREERVLAWLGIFFLIASVIPQYLDFFGVTSSTITPYWEDIQRIILIILPILAVLIVVVVIYSRKKRISQSILNRSHKKMECRIIKELETEATAKNLVFSRQRKKDVLSILASRLSSDIVEKTTPKKYVVQTMKDRDGDVCIDKDILSIPLQSAETLADKMTKLSEDPKYRKKWRMLLLP
jgi:hypothetical protein